jgi:hypothetical protein
MPSRTMSRSPSFQSEQLQSAVDADQDTSGTVPGYVETRGGRVSSPRNILVQKGEEAVVAATNAIASQIGSTAARIANVIDERTKPVLSDGVGIDSIEVAFGITLAAGLTTVFTAQAQSSVVVTITLSPKSGSITTVAGHDH